MAFEYSPKQEEFVGRPFDHTLDWAEGTPRSGKTVACTHRFARHIIETTDLLHLVVAYSQEQAFRLIMDGNGLGLIGTFQDAAKLKHDDTGDHLMVETPNGIKRIYYKGGGKKDSRNSITGLSLGSVYFCEIDLIHADMIQECFRRTFAAKDRWHIADLNPPAPMHPVIQDVLNIQDAHYTHWTLNDNPAITPERLEEIRLTCLKNPFLYKRDFLGERAIPQGVIYSMFDPKRHVLDTMPFGDVSEMFFAADGGVSDPTTVGCYAITKSAKRFTLYRIANWYYDGGALAMSQQAREIVQSFIPYCRNKVQTRESSFFVDPACRALRMELELLGVQTNGADNNSRDVRGSSKGIKVGIEYLQSAISDGRFYVVDDLKYGAAPFIREVGMYCVDDNGNPVDAYNHCMDEARYANNYFYKNYVI